MKKPSPQITKQTEFNFCTSDISDTEQPAAPKHGNSSAGSQTEFTDGATPNTVDPPNSGKDKSPST